MRHPTPKAARPGRPRLPDPRIDTVRSLLEKGRTVPYIVEATGVGKTKVYEVRRQLEVAAPQSGTEFPDPNQ